jgi:hypothetical protein
MTHHRQTARRSPRGGVRPELRESTPPSYKDRRRAGGPTGPRTPDERAFIVKDFIVHHFSGKPAAQPTWFANRFPEYPAYKFTPWEISFVNCEPGFITKAEFDKYCRGRFERREFINLEEALQEQTAYRAVENSLATLSRRLFDYIGEYSDYSEADWDSDSDTEKPVV